MDSWITLQKYSCGARDEVNYTWAQLKCEVEANDEREQGASLTLVTGVVQYGSPDGEARKPKRGNWNGNHRATMAAGPGVAMQSGSPARELSLSVQQAGSQTHGDRIKPEEATGKNTTRALSLFRVLIFCC